jgi:hypothetical protein
MLPLLSLHVGGESSFWCDGRERCAGIGGPGEVHDQSVL